MAELTAPLVYKNEEKRIVYGPVLIPDEPDTDGDVVTAEKIEEVAHKFVEEYGNIDLMHSLNNVGRLVESYISPVDLVIDENTIIPKGSWIMGVRVTDNDSWEAVKEGKLGGFSIMAIQKTALKSKKSKETKRVTLADLGEDWIVNAVSLVDEPAVPKAKWIAIKSKNNINSNINIDKDIVEKAVDGSLEHRKQLLDRKLDSLFASDDSYPLIHSTMMDSVIFIVRHDNGDERTFQVDYNLKEDGTVEFTSEPKEVKILETVVSMENMLGSSTEEVTDQSEKTQNENIMTKFMRSIGLGPKSEKAGRVISDSNLKKLRQAKEVIDELLAIGEKERQEEKKKEANKMNKEEVQELINKSIEPIESKLDDVLQALKNEAKETEENNDKDDKQHKEEDKQENKQEVAEKKKDDEEIDYKQKYEEVLKQIAKRPFSHRLSGQDGVEKSKDDENNKADRNAFGFKVE